MYDVMIIGSGPAAYTAAIYASRALLKTLLFAGPQPGGQLTTTTEIGNFPGFPEGIMGPELMERMRKQAEKYKTEFSSDVVSAVRKQDTRSFVVVGTKEYEGKTVIVATGARAKPLGHPDEEKYRGKGLSYCATCDGFFFKGKQIAVVGGGDTAMEEANFLSKFASKVTIIHRREEFRASPIELEKTKKNEKVSFLTNKTIDAIKGENVIQSLTLKDTVTGAVSELSVDGLFVAIGHTPATDFLKGTLVMDEKGYIQIRGTRSPTDAHTHTSVDGIFAAGDCVDVRYRQGIIASGMGAMAGIDAEKYLGK